MKKVLVVEDEKALQNAIEKKLKSSGLDAETAISVEKALEKMSESKPDLIWLDHYLIGEKNGLDLVAKIKNEDVFKDIPVFVVSNTASSDKVSSYLHLGVEKYFTKADNKLEDIISDIKRVLE